MENSMKPAPRSFDVWVSRSVYILVISMAILHSESIDERLVDFYNQLLTMRIFHSVYFETIWVPVVSTFIYAIPFIMDRSGLAKSCKLDSRMQWIDAGVKGILIETVEYCAPLLVLDTIKAKSYPGVDPQEFADKAGGWLQIERALPTSAPSLFEIVFQVAGAFVLFDAGFHHIHFMLHKSQWLYKHLHSVHHQHDHVHARVTNQLHVLERLSHILVANYALKATGAHPLTRTLFVPLFVGWLTYNHCGYEFPWMPEHIIPFGIVSGSRQHLEHHVHGSANHQPFFTYIDRFMEWQKERKLFEGLKPL